MNKANENKHEGQGVRDDKKPFKTKVKPQGMKKRRIEKSESELDQKVIDLARVTRVTAGGKRMKFRATVVIGDQKARIGLGVAKGADVTEAINKAILQAKKEMLDLSQYNKKLPHELKCKFGAARILIKPGRKGDGIIAGGVMRSIIELSGFEDIVGKMYGTKNKVNNAKAVFKALASIVDKKKKEVL